MNQRCYYPLKITLIAILSNFLIVGCNSASQDSSTTNNKKVKETREKTPAKEPDVKEVTAGVDHAIYRMLKGAKGIINVKGEPNEGVYNPIEKSDVRGNAVY